MSGNIMFKIECGECKTEPCMLTCPVCLTAKQLERMLSQRVCPVGRRDIFGYDKSRWYLVDGV